MRRTGIILTSLVAAQAVYSTDISSHKGISFGTPSAYSATLAQAGGNSPEQQQKDDTWDLPIPENQKPTIDMIKKAGYVMQTEPELKDYDKKQIEGNDSYNLSFLNPSNRKGILIIMADNESKEIYTWCPNAHSKVGRQYTDIDNDGKADHEWPKQKGDPVVNWSKYYDFSNIAKNMENLNNSGKHPEVIDLYNKYKKVSSINDANFYYQAGYAGMKIKDFELAKESFDISVEKNKEFAPTYIGLALIAIQKGSIDEAVNLSEHYLKLGGKNPTAEKIIAKYKKASS